VELTRNGAPGVPVTAPLFRQSSGEATESKSAFAELTVNPIRRLRLTGGVRYIDENQSFHQAFSRVYDPFVGPADAPLVAFSGAKTAGRLLSRFTIDYHLTDAIVFYADRSMGFRSGGLSPLGTLSESAPGQSNYALGANFSTFNPETDTSYEVGAAAGLLGDQLTARLAGFINEVYNHQQTETVTTPGYGPGVNGYVVNLPKVEIKGAELEVTLRPRRVPGLTLMGAGGYQDARIVNGLITGAEYPVDSATGQAGAPGTTVNLTGTTLERAPKANFQLRADYARQIGPGKVDFNVGYRWTDAFAFATYDGVPDVQKAYGLVDVSLGYAKSFYKIMVTAKNITNVLYATNASPALFRHGWGDPRTVVAEIRLRF
jgi:iron complex outermembrane receptor protein